MIRLQSRGTCYGYDGDPKVKVLKQHALFEKVFRWRRKHKLMDFSFGDYKRRSDKTAATNLRVPEMAIPRNRSKSARPRSAEEPANLVTAKTFGTHG